MAKCQQYKQIARRYGPDDTEPKRCTGYALKRWNDPDSGKVIKVCIECAKELGYDGSADWGIHQLSLLGAAEAGAAKEIAQ